MAIETQGVALGWLVDGPLALSAPNESTEMALPNPQFGNQTETALSMRIRRITKEQVAVAPYKVWNAFVDLLYGERYDDLAPEQRVAQLVIQYDGEVQNGGHLQYFENRHGERLDETIAALGTLGAASHQQVLREATALWRSRNREPIQTVDEYCETALDGEFSELDTRIYKCTPTLQKILESHLNQNVSTYVLIE